LTNWILSHIISKASGEPHERVEKEFEEIQKNS
jgi:hypothetical protein